MGNGGSGSSLNNKNGAKLIYYAVVGVIVLITFVYTVIRDKTSDRWTKLDETTARLEHNRIHDQLNKRIEKCCQ